MTDDESSVSAASDVTDVIAPLTVIVSDVSGTTFESVATSVNVSPTIPTIGTVNDPSFAALSGPYVNPVRVLRAVNLIGRSESVTAPIGPTTLSPLAVLTTRMFASCAGSNTGAAEFV